MKYEAEIYHVEASYDADFDYATEIEINCTCQNRSYLDDVIILKTMKT